MLQSLPRDTEDEGEDGTGETAGNNSSLWVKEAPKRKSGDFSGCLC